MRVGTNAPSFPLPTRVEDLDRLAILSDRARPIGVGRLFAPNGSLDINPAWSHEGSAIRDFIDRHWDVRAEPKDLSKNVARLKSKRGTKRIGKARGAAAPHKTLPEAPAFTGIPMNTRLRGYFALPNMLSPRAAALREIALQSPAVITIGGDHHQFLIDALLIHGVNMGLRIAEEDLARDVETTSSMAMLANRALGEERFSTLTHGTKDVKAARFDREVEAIEAFLHEHWVISAAPKRYAAYKEKHARDPRSAPAERVPFAGAPLHFKLGAGCLPFDEHMREDHVLYDDVEQGRAPIETLIGSILRQGINIALNTVDAAYSGVIAARREEMLRALGGKEGDDFFEVLMRFELEQAKREGRLEAHMAEKRRALEMLEKLLKDLRPNA